jgi:hypothetical protein
MVGDDTSEGCAMTSDEAVQTVEQSRRQALEDARQSPRRLQLAGEVDEPGPVADEPPVGERETPAGGPVVLGKRREQVRRPLVAEAEIRQLIVAIERGDDPRRPAAEASVVGVDENGTNRVVRHTRYAAEGLPAGVKRPTSSSVLEPVFSTMCTWRGRSRNAEPRLSSSMPSSRWSRPGPSGIQTISS